MDLAKMRKIAGISEAVKGDEVADIRKQINEELDILATNIDSHQQVDEGFFTNLRALLDVGSTAAKAAAKKAGATADAASEKIKAAFASAQGRARLKAFEKEITKVLDEFEKFDKDPDLQAVLKSDPKLARLMKSSASFLRSTINQVEAMKAPAEAE